MTSNLDTLFERRLSVRIYGLGAVALGLVGLVWGDFAVVWQPEPDGIPGQSIVGYASALPFLLAGLSLQWQRTAGFGAVFLTVLYGLAVIGLDVPRVVAHPSAFLNWYGVAEPLALLAGGLVSCAYCTRLEPATSQRLINTVRLIFGLCLVVFGLAHFYYFDYTAKLVPKWLPPNQAFWVYATAAGHLAAGAAILSGIHARAAAKLLTAMFVVFAILVHAPTIINAPHIHFNWAENAINFALIGSAWVIASAPMESRRWILTGALPDRKVIA